MKKIIGGIILAGIIFAAGAFCATTTTKTDHKPITKALINLLKNQTELQDMLETSIAEAKKINPDTATNPVQSLEQYYTFIDSASELIPQDVLNDASNLTRDQILQSICYFYFLIDQPIAQLEDKGLYKNAIQYYEPFSSWLRDFVATWGTFLNTEDSWTQTTYLEFYNDPRFGLQKDWYEPSSNWNSFNRFFSRYLKSPDVRPIASPEDTSIITAPADSVPQGVWKIDANSKILVDDGITVKLATFYSIEDLLGANSPYKDAFANGYLTHTFLNVNDYHRYHFPVGGLIRDKVIFNNQNVALEDVWNEKTKKYDPIDSTGWQFSQIRGYVIVDTGDHGLVALMPMGMAQVSSITFEDNVLVGSVHNKGDMLGSFLFGGSDFIMLFQENSGFEITAPQAKQTTNEITYDHVLMGEQYGVVR